MTHGTALTPEHYGLLAKERIIAKPGFNRWLVPPAALAIHLCIGMAYGFSVFWLPLSHAIGINEPVACAADISFFQRIFSASCDWRVSELTWMYTLFFVLLGSSAAIWGGWLERVGPRKVGMIAALCWSGGLVISAIGVHFHQIWMLWIGSGVIGGIGLGLGYISPVSTLVKWFPDRRGMATGMAIMGFGGGCAISRWTGFQSASRKPSWSWPCCISSPCSRAHSATGCRRPGGLPKAGPSPHRCRTTR